MDAEVLIGLERYDEAEELLRNTLRRAETDGDSQAASRALEGLGVVASRRGREEHALELLRKAVQAGSNPDPSERWDLYFELARITSLSGDAERAVSLLQWCLDRLNDSDDPDWAQIVRVSITLSYAHSDAGDHAAAAAVLAELVRRGAEELDANLQGTLAFALGRLHHSTGHIEQALVDLTRAVELSRQSGDEYAAANTTLSLATVLLTLDRTQDAAATLADARRLFGDGLGTVDEGFLKVDEARLALQLGDTQSAIGTAREAIELLAGGSVPGELGMANLVLAKAYDEIGENERAEASYSTSIDLFERQRGWRMELGRAYREYGKFLRRQGRTEAALEALERAADLAPSTRDPTDG